MHDNCVKMNNITSVLGCAARRVCRDSPEHYTTEFDINAISNFDQTSFVL